MSARTALLAALFLLATGCDQTPPVLVEVGVVTDTNLEDGPYAVRAVVNDRSGIDRVRLFYTARALSEVREMERVDEPERTDGWRFRGLIDGQPIGTVVRFGVEACDTRGNCALDPLTYPLAAHTFRVGLLPSAPELSGLSPDRGPSSGGTQVQIDGADFRPGAQVFFGERESARTERVRADLLIAVTPPGEVGTVDVSVVNPDGESAVLPRAFTYVPSPELESVNPELGPSSGGTLVAIDGANFPEEGLRVLFDSIPCRELTVLSAEQLTCVTPPGHPGFVDVQLSHDALGGQTLPDAFEYIPPPVVDRAAPSGGPDTGGTVVVLEGENFEPGVLVLVGGNVCVVAEVATDGTSLTCTVPAGNAGVADIVVRNPDGQDDTLEGGFNYLGPPIIAQLRPALGPIAGGTEVRILGAGYSDVMEVEIGGQLAEVTAILDALEIDAVVPPALGPLTPAPRAGCARSTSR